MAETVIDLGKKAKAQYPGAYDHLDDAELGRKMQAQFPGAYDHYTDITDGSKAPPPGAKPPASAEPTLAGFGQNLMTSGKDFFGNLYHAVTNPRETGKGMYNLGMGVTQKFIPGEWPQEKYADAFGQVLAERYGSPEAVGRTLYTDPVGTLSDLSMLSGAGGLALKGVKLGSEAANLTRLASMAGRTAQGLEAISAATDPLRLAGRAATLPLKVTKVPERWYQSALNPGPGTYTTPQVKSMIQTGINEGIPVSERGVQKLWALIKDLDAKATSAIEGATERGVTVAPEKIASRVDDIVPLFKNQANPEASLKIIDKAKQEFLRQHRTRNPFTEVRPSLEGPGLFPAGTGETVLPKPIPASQAQLIKQGTYRALKDSAYGELKSAKIETWKGIARGVREELATAIPEIGAITERESEALGLMPALEHAVRRQGGHRLFGIATPLTATAVGTATGSGPAAAAAAVMRSVIDDPYVKSRLAIAINRAQKANPGKFTPARGATAVSRIEDYLRSLQALQASPSLAPATSRP